MSAAVGILANPYTAEVSPYGGGLLSLSFEDKPLVTPPPREFPVPFDAGCLLAPWPNRTADGTYDFSGETHHLSITEPSRRNAIHGFVRHLNWQEKTRSPEAVTFKVSLDPQPGWPWEMGFEMSWELSSGSGLTGTFCATNASSFPCPLGFGWHPYVSAFGAPIDECVMVIPPVENLRLDAERKLPFGQPAPSAVFAGSSDGIALRGQWFDNALRVLDGVCRGVAGSAGGFSNGQWDSLGGFNKSLGLEPVVNCQLLDSAGRGVELWAGNWCRWLQVYTADATHGEAFPGVENGRALAIEPMSCPPNSLASGVDLLTLQSGETRSFRFGIRAAC